MDQSAREKLLQAAIAIGDDMLAKAKTDDNGLYWETMNLDDERKPIFTVSDSIYSGAAGIALFLLELYKQTNDQRYIDAVQQAMAWLAHRVQNDPSTYYALYTGRLSIAVALLRYADYAGHEEYRALAIEVAKNAGDFLNHVSTIDDLINGLSGTVLGLLTIHAHTGEESLLDVVEAISNDILSRTQMGLEGIYWDRSDKNITGLCGYSHGAAGIGAVFLEMGQYFNNDAYRWVARQAFTYENSFYNEAANNWPDNRKGIYDQQTLEEFKQKYNEGDKAFFTTAGDMAAWCHGAPGIGLARLRAVELLGDEQYKTDLQRAMDKTEYVTVQGHTPFHGYIVCHGHGGNAMLFLEAYRQTGNAEYLKKAETVALNGVKSFEENGFYYSGYSTAGEAQDTSLFMGNAGVGYYYLQTLAPDEVPSVVTFHPGSTTYSGPGHRLQTVTFAQVLAHIAGKHFGRTNNYYQMLNPNSTVFDGFVANGQRFQEALVAHVGQKVAGAGNEQLTDVFNLEKAGVAIDLALESHSYIKLHQALQAEKNMDYLEESAAELPGTLLQLDPHAQLMSNNWAWPKEGDAWKANAQAEAEGAELLLMPGAMGTQEHPLNQFSYLVLEGFEQPSKVSTVVDEMVGNFDASSPEEVQQVKDATMQQITEAMQSGFLVLAN